MKIKFLVASILIIASNFSISAEISKSVRDLHAQAHKAQLANVKSHIDKASIESFLKNNIEKREAAATGMLSSESRQMINDLLVEANKHIGKRYRSGAKGPSQFDCSGFSSYVYKQFGYNLSPSSRAQYTQGVPVDRKDLRKGDLVFFTSRSSGKNVGHVGIVVSADNETGSFKFIHASIKGVKISDFEGYYVPRYIGARRVITE